MSHLKRFFAEKRIHLVMYAKTQNRMKKCKKNKRIYYFITDVKNTDIVNISRITYISSVCRSCTTTSSRNQLAAFESSPAQSCQTRIYSRLPREVGTLIRKWITLPCLNQCWKKIRLWKMKFAGHRHGFNPFYCICINIFYLRNLWQIKRCLRH